MEKVKLRDLFEGDYFKFEGKEEIYELVSYPTDGPLSSGAYCAPLKSRVANWYWNVLVEKVEPSAVV